MKKELQQKYPNLDKFLLCFPSTWNVPSTSFSPAQIFKCLLKSFCDSSSQKETLHHPDDHSTLSGLFSKYYPSSSLLITEVKLYLKPTFMLKAAGFYSFLSSLSPIDSSTLSQPSMVVKIKTWVQKLDRIDINPDCTAYWLLLAVWSWLSHFTSLNLGSLIFNR